MADFKKLPSVNGVSVSLSGHAHNLADVTGLQTALGKKLDTTANAASATKLNTARTLTIGITGKTFDGSANVSWTLAEIGAAAVTHTHTSSQITDATDASTANSIVKRNANGDFTGRYVNSMYLNMSHSAATRNSDTVFYSSTDTFVRKNTAAGMVASLGSALTNVVDARIRELEDIEPFLLLGVSNA